MPPKLSYSRLLIPNILLGYLILCSLWVLWYILWEYRDEPPFPIPSPAINIVLMVVFAVLSSAVRELYIMQKPDINITGDVNKHVFYLLVVKTLPTIWFTIILFPGFLLILFILAFSIETKISYTDNDDDNVLKKMGITVALNQYPNTDSSKSFNNTNLGRCKFTYKDVFDPPVFKFSCSAKLRDEKEYRMSQREVLSYLCSKEKLSLDDFFNSQNFEQYIIEIEYYPALPNTKKNNLNGKVWPTAGFQDFYSSFAVREDDFISELIHFLYEGENIEDSKYTCKLTARTYQIVRDKNNNKLKLSELLFRKVIPEIDDTNEKNLRNAITTFCRKSTKDDSEMYNSSLSFICNLINNHDDIEWRTEVFKIIYETLVEENTFDSNDSLTVNRLGTLLSKITYPNIELNQNDSQLEDWIDKLLPIIRNESPGYLNSVDIYQVILRLITSNKNFEVAKKSLQEIDKQIGSFGATHNNIKSSFIGFVNEETIYKSLGTAAYGLKESEELYTILLNTLLICAVSSAGPGDHPDNIKNGINSFLKNIENTNWSNLESFESLNRLVQ